MSEKSGQKCQNKNKEQIFLSTVTLIISGTKCDRDKQILAAERLGWNDLLFIS